jgi:hypothetical protein
MIREVTTCLAAVAICLSGVAKAQTGFQNGTDDWMKTVHVNGSKGQSLGWIYNPPHSTLYMENGQVAHGAGKFVGDPPPVSGQIGLGCQGAFFTLPLDFVAIVVSEIEWDRNGEPIRIVLKKPVITTHGSGAGDNDADYVDVPLQPNASGDFFRIVRRSDEVVLKDIAGTGNPQPNVFVSFDIPSAGLVVHKKIGMLISYNKCKMAMEGEPIN